MTEETKSDIPNEGSNHIEAPEGQPRSNITDTMSGRHPKSDSNHVDDDAPDEGVSTDGENRIPQPGKSGRLPQE